MSFDLSLIRLENGEPVQADRRAILEVFRRYPNVDAGGSGFYDVSFDDGSHVQLLASAEDQARAPGGDVGGWQAYRDQVVGDN